MKKFSYVIKDEIGIHARPAGQIVKIAKELQSNLTIDAEGKTADMKKLMAVMALGVKKGANVTITADGADEDAAIAQLEEFFKSNL
ncbi:HPr family phosphocarrier protein [Anaerocolumna cellulosilytica]|nr:HPr family phosphocarrier protein [Anaerocolumna cellulosilytica]MBB5194704.1 phosphocarrier protein [Anaerocolumna cellulosilytica]